MPPKTRYTRDVVLSAALQVVQKDGIQGVSARTVAKALGSSTAPVSTAFDNMQALDKAIVDRLVEKLLREIDRTEASDPLRGAAFAMARFTADEPRYYEALFLTPHPSPTDWAGVRGRFSSPLGTSERFAHLTPRQCDALAWRASVVAHGICTEIWSGRWTRTTNEDLWRLVDLLVEPILATVAPPAPSRLSDVTNEDNR